MLESAGIKNWVPQLIVSLQRVNILVLSGSRFSDSCDKIIYAWKEQRHKKFYITGEISFLKGYILDSFAKSFT